MDIGTAKPTMAERAVAPHHLIDILDPNEPFDVASYVQLADEAIKGIAARGRIAFVVGGTGLYIKALIHGLAKAPARDEGYRAELKKVSNLYEILQEKDPVAASLLKPNDTSRIVRALEVLHVTGCSISTFQKGHGFKEKRYDALKIGLERQREELYRRVNERVDKMIADGLVDEVRGLVEKYGPDCQALKAVGYKEFVGLWVCGLTEKLRNSETQKLTNLVKRNTRRYAKRQMTWFRADKEIKWFEPDQIKEIKKVVEKFIKNG